MTAWTARAGGRCIYATPDVTNRAGRPRISRASFAKEEQMKRFVLVVLAAFGLSMAALPVGLQAQGKAKSMSASGTVKAVTGTSLTVTAAGGKEMTFTIDSTTKFVGKGLGTKAKAGKLTATDAVGMNDRVSVTYHDMGGTLHAASVRVNSKGTTTK